MHPAPMRVITTGDGSRTLYSPKYRQAFFSHHGAVTESRYVFLAGVRIADRLSLAAPLRVLEVGFGSGLNFLLTAELARAAGATLHYTGLEQSLPSVLDLEALAYDRMAEVGPLAESLRTWRSALPEPLGAGSYRQRFPNHTWLTLRIGDATRQRLAPQHFDAIFLDGFSPDVNPELWTPHFLRTLFQATAPDGILATYSAAGHVRRALSGAGYRVIRRDGPPGKREVLAAAH